MLPFLTPTAFLSVLFSGEVLALRAYLVQKSLPIGKSHGLHGSDWFQPDLTK